MHFHALVCNLHRKQLLKTQKLNQKKAQFLDMKPFVFVGVVKLGEMIEISGTSHM